MYIHMTGAVWSRSPHNWYDRADSYNVYCRVVDNWRDRSPWKMLQLLISIPGFKHFNIDLGHLQNLPLCLRFNRSEGSAVKVVDWCPFCWLFGRSMHAVREFDYSICQGLHPFFGVCFGGVSEFWHQWDVYWSINACWSCCMECVSTYWSCCLECFGVLWYGIARWDECDQDPIIANIYIYYIFVSFKPRGATAHPGSRNSVPKCGSSVFSSVCVCVCARVSARMPAKPSVYLVVLCGFLCLPGGPGLGFTGSFPRYPSGVVRRQAMDSVFSIFHPNFPGRLSDEAKRARMDELLEKARSKAAEEGYVLSREAEDFHKRKGWSTRQVLQWFDKHQDGLWCRLLFSARKKGNRQMSVITAKVWNHEMELHLSQADTNTKIVVVKDLTNLKLFCTVAGIGYTRTIFQWSKGENISMDKLSTETSHVFLLKST